MRRPVAVGLVLAVATGCHPDEGASSAPVGDALATAECDWQRTPEPSDADEPPCDIEFREVVRLEGDLDGVIPTYVVMALSDGRYLTGYIRTREDRAVGTGWSVARSHWKWAGRRSG